MLTQSRQQTEATLLNHIQAFGKGDVAAIMADYAEEARFFTPEGLLQGKDQIKSLFEQLVASFPPGSTTIEISQQLIEGETAYVVWSGESPYVKVPFATDTLIVRDGKIVVQSFAAQVEQK